MRGWCGDVCGVVCETGRSASVLFERHIWEFYNRVSGLVVVVRGSFVVVVDLVQGVLVSRDLMNLWSYFYLVIRQSCSGPS